MGAKRRMERLQLWSRCDAFGYPQQWEDDVAAPMPRLFKGHIQRFFAHQSYLKYRYLAAELSFGCPSGLSGSAITNAQHQGRLYGIVAENVRTTTEIKSLLEVQDDGIEYRESFHDYLNYGVAVWLPDVADWLNAVVPVVPHDEILRRSHNQHAWATEERDALEGAQNAAR